MMRRNGEPDFDERDPSVQWDAENEWGRGLCKRCGHDDHQSKHCPHVNLLTYRGKP